MKRLISQFPLYSWLLRLYPTAYRNHYEHEILQTTADMLDDTPNSMSRLTLWLTIFADLSYNAVKQQLIYAGGEMNTHTPHYVKRNSILAGVLLVPFFGALLANSIDKIVNNHDLYNSWLWHTPILSMWVLALPAIAFVLAVTSYVIYLFGRNAGTKFTSRLLDIVHSWPVLVTGILAFGILAIVFFHDSVHCWVKSPAYVASHVSQTWQCSEQGRTSLPQLLKRAF